jgi:hypothetical protein
MKTQRRLQFIYWLRHRVAKSPEGEVSPKWISVVYAILFPLRNYYATQSNFRFDYERNTLIMGKINFSMQVLDQLVFMANSGDWFEFVSRETSYGEKLITIKMIRKGAPL